MKNCNRIILGVFLLGFGNAFAQEKVVIEKEVKMEVVDDEKVLTITTTENDKQTLEVFKGDDADQKLKELEGSEEQVVTEEIKLEEINGEKTLTIERNENGTISQETYKGQAAEDKLKQIESQEQAPQTVKKVEKTTVIRKVAE